MDYNDFMLIHKKDVCIMQAFVENGFKGSNIKALNFDHKFIQDVSFVNITTVNNNHI